MKRSPALAICALVMLLCAACDQGEAQPPPAITPLPSPTADPKTDPPYSELQKMFDDYQSTRVNRAIGMKVTNWYGG